MGTVSELATGDSRCPWCGKSALGTKLIGSGSAMYPYSYAVACRTCGAQGPKRPTPEGAEAAWGERKTKEAQVEMACPVCGEFPLRMAKTEGGKLAVLCEKCGTRGPEAGDYELAERAYERRADAGTGVP